MRHKVPPDYHVVIEGVAYSVPYRLIGKTVDVHRTASLVSIFHKAERVASHADWGLITVGLLSEGNNCWLVVEDNGIGMSEQVLTGPLLDFGTSFWRSPLAIEEFPGLMASGMHASGKFGIGFFSVFMLGPVVRVYSRRCDRGQETGRLLEFREGTSARPICHRLMKDRCQSMGEPVSRCS